MATDGPRFPGTTANLANAGTSEDKDAWTNPGNVVSDNATEATITAATFDSPDISQILVASNFGFAISALSVTGITVEIDRRSIIAGSGADFRVQLATGTTFANLVGANKAATATTWPSTTAIASYGGAADTWTANLTPAQVNASTFAVFLSASAKIANADIGVDFIRVTVTYTAASPVTAAPTAGSLTLTASTPTVAATDHISAAPTEASLALTGDTPTVTVGVSGVTAEPTAASLSLSASTPSVAAVQVYTPTAAALTLTPATPAIVAPVALAPSAAALALSPATPIVLSPRASQPAAASLSLSLSTPAVSAPQAYAPSAASLTLTGAVPNMGGSVSAVPTAAVLGLTGSVPSIATPIAVSPSAVALLIAFGTPDIAAGASLAIVPGAGVLVLTGLVPSVVSGSVGPWTVTVGDQILYRATVSDVPLGSVTVSDARE